MNYKKIKMKSGLEILVDSEDFSYLNKWSWHSNINGHPCRTIRNESGKHTVLMHREIMKAKKGQFIDHTNRNVLDNRKFNLRFCSRSQNSMNKAKVNHFSSKYKGVDWVNAYKRWRVGITAKTKRYYLGLFKNEEEAGKAYDIKAKELHGKFAVLNFN